MLNVSTPSAQPTIDSPSGVHKDGIPQIQVPDNKTNALIQGKQRARSATGVESVPDFTAFITDDITEDNNSLTRSKSHLELRSVESGSRLESLAISPITSPRSLTPTPDNRSPIQPVNSTALNSSNEANASSSTNIRRSRSTGYNRLSGRYVESVAMHIPSPRICSVAISPTGKLIYFKTIHCKNMVLPSVASPQPATGMSGNATSSTSSEPPATETSVEADQSTGTNVNLTTTTTRHSSSDKSPRRGSRARENKPVDDSSTTTPRSADSDEKSTETKSHDSPDQTSESAKDLKSPDKLKDKLKSKLKDLVLLKDKLKVGKAKAPPKQGGQETSEGFIGEFNLATFKIRHTAGNNPLFQQEAEDSDDAGFSDGEFSSEGSESGDTDDDLDVDAEGMGNNLRKIASTAKIEAINNTINSIINKDNKPGNQLTLPFYGVFPRTYPELNTILHGCKVANQYTTNDTQVLAQLKSLNSVSCTIDWQ